MDEWRDIVVKGDRPAEIDGAEVASAVALLFHPTAPHEIRGLPSGRSRLVLACCRPELLKAARELADDRGIYYTLNPVRPDLGDRAAKTADITARWNLLIDIDAVKADPNGMATDAEKAATLEVAAAVFDDLTARGWPAPLVLDSGNGVHLVHRVDLPANDLIRVLFGKLLRALAAKHDTPRAKIDVKVHNAGRIAKLPGTWVRKGAQSADRPHRMSRITWAPAALEPVSLEQIQAVAGLPADVEASGPTNPPAPADFWDVMVKASPDRAASYVQSAVEREIARAVLAPEGGRNDSLNRAAFAIGQFVGAGLFARPEAEARLEEAARRSGLAPGETAKTIASGLDTGIQQPRVLPASATGTNGVHRNGKAAPPASQGANDPTKRIIVLASEVTPRRVEWLWHDRIPIGKLTTFAGWGGLGKSFVTMDLAARISQGDEIPGAQGLCFDPASVLILNTEDDPDDTSVPRLMEAGANLRRVGFARSEVLGRFNLGDLKTLDAMIDQLGGVKLVVIDPATAHLGDVNDHKNAELRGLLMPLSLWAMARKVAVVLVTHVNKAQAGNVEAMSRVVGSVAWVNAVRAAVMFARDPKDKDRRLFVPFKANNAPERKALAYKIVPTADLARVEWLGEVDVTADEAMNGGQSFKGKADIPGTILRSILAGGAEVHSVEVVEKANKAYGIDKEQKWWKAILNRLGGSDRRSGFSGKVLWSIQGDEKTESPV